MKNNIKIMMLAILLSISCVSALKKDSTGDLELSIGPVELVSENNQNTHHNHSDLPFNYIEFKFPEDGWVTHFEPVLSNEDKVVPGALLHHIILGDHDRKSPLCNSKETNHDFHFLFASGAELTPIVLPNGYGIPVNSDTTYTAGGVFAPLPGESYSNVKFKASIGFKPRSGKSLLKPILPVWIDVQTNCSQNGYIVASNKPDVRRREFKFPFSGKLFLGVGHLHKSGKELKIYERDSGDILMLFNPQYRDNYLDKIAPVLFEDGIRIEKDTTYVIESSYDSDMPHDISAMGIVMAFVSPDNLRSAQALSEKKKADFIDLSGERGGRPTPSSSAPSSTTTQQKEAAPKERQDSHQGHNH
jgi:hypothetical protein